MTTTSAPTRPVMPPHDHKPHPYTGPSRQEVLAMRQQYCNPAIFTLYQDPLMIVEGHMQYLYDETGRRYLDLFAGIVTVSCGHSHPKVVARMKEQLDLITHTTTIYLHPNFPAMAKKLASKMPQGLDVTYFTNSGSEANDLAMLIARLYTGSNDIIAVRNSYHGNSPTAMAATSHHTWKYPAQLNSGIHHSISPDPYRSPFSGTPEQIASQAADDIRQLIRYSTPGRVAGFIAEPIQGVGGATHGASNYLREAYAVIRENGGLCIADEVQTGFGRTGDHYWGFQNFGVVRTSSRWPRESATGRRSPPSPPGATSRASSPNGSTSTPSAATPFRWRRASPCSTQSTKTDCRKTRRWWGAASSRGSRSCRPAIA
jgi:4-aminobutyrate aminotransferase and related aminotransferases